MSWWNAKYKNNQGEYEITFASKTYEKAKAVERICQAVIDKKVKSREDVAAVVRCKGCKHWVKCESPLIGEVMCCTGQGSVKIQKAADDFCSYGERERENE